MKFCVMAICYGLTNCSLPDVTVSRLPVQLAISNEPFFDQFLGVDLPAVFAQCGLEVVADMPSNPDKWPELEDAPVRVMVARKPL